MITNPLQRPNVFPDSIVDARKYIPDEIFKEIPDWVPIPMVYFVVTRVVNGTREFMLVFRTKAPFNDTWFATGGRNNVGESTWNALARQAKRKLDLDINQKGVLARFAGVQDVLNPDSTGEGAGVCRMSHSKWLLHEIQILDPQIEVKAENKKIQWFRNIDPSFPEPVKEALSLMGFTSGKPE